MIPVLYEKNETRFLNYGLGEIDFTFVDVERERNGIYTFYGEYPADGLLANELIEERQIKSNAGKRTKWQTFVIDRVNRRSKDVIKVYAVHVSQTTATMSLTPEVGVPSGTASYALNVWKSHLQGNREFDTWSDIATVGTTTWKAQSVQNARQALGGVKGSILDIWGGEYEFDNNLIRLHKQMGRNTPTTIEYGRNLKSAEVDKQITNTVTSIVPYAVYFEGGDAESGEGGEEVYVWLDEVVIHGPHRDKWAYDRVQPVDFSSEFGYENRPTQERLRSLAKSYVTRNDIGVPRTKITLEMVDLANTLDYEDVEIIEEVELCDFLPVYYPSLGIADTQAKISSTRFNALTDEYISVSIGVVGEGFTTSIRNDFQDGLDLLDRKTQAVGNRIPYLINALGQRIWYETPDPNMEHKKGDTWFEKNGIYHRIHIWDGQRWELIIDSEDVDAVDRRIDEVEQQAQELMEDVEATENKVQQAIEDAGLAQVTAQTAQSTAETAQAEAESAKSGSNEAIEKAILAGTDAETAKQNALDAVSQVSEAKRNASEALGKAGEAVSKANDAIGKANRIPQDIQDEIESKGLVSGSWVESHVNDVTGEINYALSEVSGSIPTVILGVTWDKSENPILTRTDYVEEYANLSDYLLKTNEIDYSIEGLSGHISRVETNKLDSTEFTSFKTNDYDVTVEGFRTALTDKLDEETFNTFKTNEFEMTVDGINGSIESLQTEKLDSTDFNTFKSNEYELTVDGLRMDLTSVSGSIPTVIMGVEWDKSQNPELTRTDYLEYDNPNLYSPSFIMGVRWDKTESPKLYRTDDTGGVGDYEYSQQTAQFVSDISGLSGRVESVETNKLGTNEFNSFKTNTYAIDLAGLRTNITSLDEGKLGSDEFSNFKTNVFDVSVDGIGTEITNLQKNKLDDSEFESFKTNEFNVTVGGLSGRIGTVETEKLDSETYDIFKTNTYNVDVGGLKSRMSSVESKKLDSGTFETFRDTTYSNTIEGITGSISALQEDKLDNDDFNSFKQNEYEVTVDGLKMGLTDVQGSFPTIVLGVEWDKSSDPKLTRTDFSEVDNPNLYAPSFVMGVMWDKKESPTMYRVADTGGVGEYEFTALQADYNFTKENWSTRLSQIENAGYATQSWSNQTFATPQSVSTQLQSYAKTTDLSGMVTETLLEQRNYLTASQAVQTFVQTEMLDGEIVSVLSSGTSQTAQYIQDYVIGEDYISEVIQTSDLVQSEIKRIVPVPTEAEIIALAEATQLDRADIEAMFEDGFLTEEDIQTIADMAGITAEQAQIIVTGILSNQLVQQYETVEAEVVLYEHTNNKLAQNDGTFNWVDYTFDFPLEEGESYPFSFQYPVDFNAIPFVIRTVGSGGVEGSNIHEGLYVVSTQDEQRGWARGIITPNRKVDAGAIVRFKFTDSRTGSFQGIQDFNFKGNKEIQVPVVSENNGVIANRITQTQNAIDIGLFGEEGALTRIYAGEEGLYLKGENIVLDGKVSMEQAFIRNLVASDITANTIASVSATFTNLISTNIDAQSITTNTLTALRARIMGTYTYVDISGTGIGINRNDGNRSIELNQNGMEVYRTGGSSVGRVGGANDGSNNYFGIMHIGAHCMNAVALSSKKNGTNNDWVRSLWVDGSGGQIKVGEPIMSGESGYGFTVDAITISNYGTGLALRSSTNPNVGIAFLPNGVWWRNQSHAWRNISDWATGT